MSLTIEHPWKIIFIIFETPFPDVPIGIHACPPKSISLFKRITLFLKSLPVLTNFARPANSSALLILKTLFSSLYQRVFSFLFQTEFWTKYFQVSSLSPYVNLAICSPIIDKSKPLTFILASLAFFIMFFYHLLFLF